MKRAVADPVWLSETDSTQDVVSARVASGESDVPPVMALSQTAGRGRLGRSWLDESGHSLLVSFALPAYADHKHPWLVGMGVALGVAGALQTQVRWPNDLTVGGRKVGGVLIEMVSTPDGRRVPVIGIGMNLAQTEFPPELEGKATSLLLARGHRWAPEKAWEAVQAAIEAIPEPTTWEVLRPLWEVFDDTPGKHYTMPDGRTAVALGIGPDGQMIASVEGETVGVLAAEAQFPGVPVGL